MNATSLLLQPLTGALAGWLTVSLLLYFLFRPRKAIRLGGFTIQGWLPAQQSKLAAGIAKELMQSLRQSGLTERLNQPEIIRSVLPGIEAHIDRFLKQRLSEKLPALAMFLSDEILQTIKVTLTDEIASLLPDVLGKIAEHASSHPGLEEIVSNQISAMPIQKIEALLARSAGRLRLFGLGVGLAVGLLMTLILWCF